ncbi:uncharacterized protein IWZ02DRAFT_456607 [Phyllosticta citriasiana]|uniref:uncharacterized protein n=1 Tax=Phyllosticta citriasiana TaxID=595635 RepID=UPI0030FDAE77
MIVERPERVLASILGIATAYVRFGERHAGGPHAPHPKRDPASDVPFTIKRSSRVQDITSPMELQEMVARIEEADKPKKPEFHHGDLYLSAESLNALQGALGGVCPRGQPRNAFVCIRPPGHHCSSDWPSGFCWLNNVHVGIEYAAQNHGLTHAAIIDFDLHHGDGSQSITWERNEKPWKTEEDFWKLYENKYLVLLEKARAFLRLHTQRLRSSPARPSPRPPFSSLPDSDASEWEGAGMQRHKVNVPTEFYARFTRDIVKMSQEPELGAEGRVISVLEGGYSNRALTSGVLSHISVAPANPFAQDVPMGNTVIQHTLGEAEKQLRYNGEWWHETSLYALERCVQDHDPTLLPRHIVTARKVVDPEKIHQEFIGRMGASQGVCQASDPAAARCRLAPRPNGPAGRAAREEGEDAPTRGAPASRTDGDRRKTTDDEEAAGMAKQRRTSLASDVTGERPTSKGSAVAVRQPAGTTAGNVQVKKTRTAPKKEVPAMKPPPRPFASRMGSHAEGKRSSSGASSSASHDKITLKMPTKEEHDAKQNAAAEEEKAKRKATSTKTRGKAGVVRGAGRKPASPTTGSSTETGPPAATTNLGLPPGMPARTQSENDTTAKPNTRNKPPMHLPEARPRSLSRHVCLLRATPNGILETAEHVPAMVPRPDTPPPPPPVSMPHFVNYEPAVGGVGVVCEGQQKPSLAHHPASAPALPTPATLRWVPLNADVDASIVGRRAANSFGRRCWPRCCSHIPFGPAPGVANGAPSLAALTGQDAQRQQQFTNMTQAQTQTRGDGTAAGPESDRMQQ